MVRYVTLLLFISALISQTSGKWEDPEETKSLIERFRRYNEAEDLTDYEIAIRLGRDPQYQGIDKSAYADGDLFEAHLRKRNPRYAQLKYGNKYPSQSTLEEKKLESYQEPKVETQLSKNEPNEKPSWMFEEDDYSTENIGGINLFGIAIGVILCLVSFLGDIRKGILPGIVGTSFFLSMLEYPYGMFFFSLFIGGAVPGIVVGLIEIFKGNGGSWEHYDDADID